MTDNVTDTELLYAARELRIQLLRSLGREDEVTALEPVDQVQPVRRASASTRTIRPVIGASYRMRKVRRVDPPSVGLPSLLRKKS